MTVANVVSAIVRLTTIPPGGAASDRSTWRSSERVAFTLIVPAGVKPIVMTLTVISVESLR